MMWWWNNLDKDDIKMFSIFGIVISILIIMGIYIWWPLMIVGGWLLGVIIGSFIAVTLIDWYENHKWKKIWNERR